MILDSTHSSSAPPAPPAILWRLPVSHLLSSISEGLRLVAGEVAVSSSPISKGERGQGPGTGTWPLPAAARRTSPCRPSAARRAGPGREPARPGDSTGGDPPPAAPAD